MSQQCLLERDLVKNACELDVNPERRRPEFVKFNGADQQGFNGRRWHGD